MDSDSQRWNRRYSSPQFRENVSPDSLLVEYADCFKPGEVVADIASGAGRNTVFLASLGCVAVAFDISITALERCRKSSQDRFEKVHPVAVDFERFRFAPDVLDAAVCFNYLNRELMSNLKTAIKPGGWLIYKTMNSNFLREHPEFNPAYVLEDGELERVFGDFRVIASQDEQKSPQAVKSFIVAQR